MNRKLATTALTARQWWVPVLVMLTLGSGTAHAQSEATKGQVETQEPTGQVEERGVPGGFSVMPPVRVIQCPDVSKPVSGIAELCVDSVGATAEGFITFRTKNIGLRTTERPFRADIYVNGQLQDTVQVGPLGGFPSVQTITSTKARLPLCLAGRIRIVLDTQQVVNEQDELNNDYAVDRTAPCPDATAIIDQDRMNNNLEYKVQIRVVNNGGAPTSPLDARIVTATQDPIFGGPSLQQCESAAGNSVAIAGCLDVTRRIPNLAPGQIEKLTVGPKTLASKRVAVVVTIQCVPGTQCLDSNTANNRVQRTLGPH